MDYSVFNSLNSGKKLSSADKANLFTERMSSTAHQREVEDLKKAGLNPVLSADSSGATTGSAAEESEDYTVDNPVYKVISNINKITNKTAKSFAEATKSLSNAVTKSVEVADKSLNVSDNDVTDITNSLMNMALTDDLTANSASKAIVDKFGTQSSNNSNNDNGSSKKSFKDKVIGVFNKLVPKAEKNKDGSYKANVSGGWSKIPILGSAAKAVIQDLTDYTGRDVGTALGSPFISPLVTIIRNLKKETK